MRKIIINGKFELATPQISIPKGALWEMLLTQYCFYLPEAASPSSVARTCSRVEGVTKFQNISVVSFVLTRLTEGGFICSIQASCLVKIHFTGNCKVEKKILIASSFRRSTGSAVFKLWIVRFYFLPAIPDSACISDEACFSYAGKIPDE